MDNQKEKITDNICVLCNNKISRFRGIFHWKCEHKIHNDCYKSKIQDIVDNQKIKCPICNADKMNYNYYMFLSIQSVTCNVM